MAEVDPPQFPTPVISDESPKVGPDQPQEKPQEKPQYPRWRLVRDVAVFQGKLALDAIRDFLLSPISIAAAIIGIIFSSRDPGRYFYNVMLWGRQSDHFINLFSAGQDRAERDGFTSVDDIVEKLEKVVVDEHERGGMTAEAKAHIDKTIDRLEGAISVDRRRLGWRIKRVAVVARREVRKVRGRISG